ncbi:hypothetical protein DCC79_13495 [bacterium]|nr:MAG: hypothetical protein DCC79_13495 [bacterium]
MAVGARRCSHPPPRHMGRRRRRRDGGGRERHRGGGDPFSHASPPCQTRAGQVSNLPLPCPGHCRQRPRRHRRICSARPDTAGQG